MVKRQKAGARAADFAPVIAAIREEDGITSASGIAKELNARGIPAARGGAWQAVQVQRLLAAQPLSTQTFGALEALTLPVPLGLS